MWADEPSRIYSEAFSVVSGNEKGDYHVLLDNLNDCIESFNSLKDKVERLNIIDWDKIPIDTLVEIRGDNDQKWRLRYFAGTNTLGNPKVFSGGCTSKTATDTYMPVQIRLAKEE